MHMQSPEPRSGFVIVNGIRMHYLEWGGDGPPILIVHATGFLGRIYRPIAEPLTAIGRVVSFDQRGHGDSGRALDGDYGWDRSVADLQGLIEALGLEGVRALGHSAGATAIGALASDRPDLIARAVLIEPVIFEPETQVSQDRQNMLYERTVRRKRSFEGVDAMYRNFENKPPYDTWRRDILRDYCEFGTRPGPEGGRELKCPPEIEAAFYQRARDFDGLGRILEAAARMLVMFGERSDSPGITLADKLAARLGSNRIVRFPDAGHFLPMEQPAEVARLAIDFFNE